jgi:hypothetical protein
VPAPAAAVGPGSLPAAGPAAAADRTCNVLR